MVNWKLNKLAFPYRILTEWTHKKRNTCYIVLSIKKKKYWLGPSIVTVGADHSSCPGYN